MSIWAEIKNALNSTLGTSNFLSLDKLIQAHGTQTFTENGTFTVPAGVTKIWVTACGAGASCSWSKGDQIVLGGQGGSAIFQKPFNVSSGQQISITIGSGGVSSTSKTGCQAGGSTVIGNLITLPGGHSTSGSAETSGIPNEGAGIGGSYRGESGQDGIIGKGGLGGRQSSSGYGYSGGGGSLGNGASAYTPDSFAGSIAGYGGGGAYSSYTSVRDGGNGIVIIEW